MSRPTSPSVQPRRLRRARARRARRLRGLVASALSAVALLMLALTGIGGSYALWTDSATVGGGTVRTSGAGLLAQWGSGHTDDPWSNMLPGDSVRRPVTLTNTGDVPLAVSATSSAPAGYEIRVAPRACTDASLTTEAVAAAPRAVATVGAGRSTAACLEVRATQDLRPSASASAPGTAFTVTFDGRQVR